MGHWGLVEVGRDLRVIDDAMNGWNLSSTQCEDVVMEKELFQSVLQHRVQLLCKYAVTNMKL